MSTRTRLADAVEMGACSCAADGWAPSTNDVTDAAPATTSQRETGHGVRRPAPRIVNNRPSMALGRAILRAADATQVGRVTRARSSSSVAYAEGRAPSRKTSASQARSRSRARAADACQASGLNQ